ncbi:sugar ABC transporter permease, partial [Rhizobium leguminosarum]
MPRTASAALFTYSVIAMATLHTRSAARLMIAPSVLLL